MQVQPTQERSPAPDEEGRAEPRPVSVPRRLVDATPSAAAGLTLGRRLRYFYKCDGGHCKFFQWQDELDKSQKHQPTLTPARGGSFPASSNGNRLGSAPARAAPVTPFKPTASRKRRASSELELEASLGSSSAQADVDDDDDIEVVGEPSTPSKQAKFTSFSTPSASARRTTTGGCEYDAIMADPTSPFHARHASLFGSSSAGAGSNVAVPTSSAGGVQGIVATLATVGPMLEDLQKELEKKDRLIKAGDKKSAGLKKKLEEAEAECETLRSKAQ